MGHARDVVFYRYANGGSVTSLSERRTCLALCRGTACSSSLTILNPYAMLANYARVGIIPYLLYKSEKGQHLVCGGVLHVSDDNILFKIRENGNFDRLSLRIKRGKEIRNR